jgi:starch synthase
MNVLFVASEAYPLIKTGGLGDVVYSLPHALAARGQTLRLVLPGYRDVLRQVADMRILGWLDVRGAGRVLSVRLVEARHPAFAFPLWLVDCPPLFDRPGNPYGDGHGHDWPDNAERFTVFARAAAALAGDALGLGWRADVVHGHDWQTGLTAAFLEDAQARPRRVFTIHNLAYGGYFSHAEFVALGLPAAWWSPEAIEFHGRFSMLKAGIVFADRVTTVSPTYAREICTPQFGFGLDGLLRSVREKLYGILNGIDTRAWDPASDPLLPAHYSADRIEPGKGKNKKALLARFLAAPSAADAAAPLLGMVSRLVEQKGVDWVIDVIPGLLAETDARLVVLGSGDERYEAQLQRLAEAHPDRVFVVIGYDEALAHRIEAGADVFLMPSRFEPCGLNQMYSLRYGTPPVVYRTGGLADTVIDADAAALAAGRATGFVFDEASAGALRATIDRALALYRQPKRWRQLQRTGMRQDFSWERSAAEYLALYQP